MFHRGKNLPKPQSFLPEVFVTINCLILWGVQCSDKNDRICPTCCDHGFFVQQQTFVERAAKSRYEPSLTDAALRTNARIREFDQKTVIGVSVSGGRAYTIRRAESR